MTDAGGAAPGGHRVAAPVFAGLFALLWLATSVRAWSLWIAAFDLGYFVQALGTVARGGPLAEIPMLGASFLGDHFSPLLIPFAALASVPGLPYWLLGLQALAVAGAAAVVWRMFGSSGGPHPVAATAVFVASPAVMYAVWNDFHASTVALPFIALFALGVVRRDVRVATAGAVLASLLREDAALQVGILAAYVCVRWWRPAVWAAIAGLAVGVVYPLAGGGTGWLTGAGLAYLKGRAWQEFPGAVLSVVWDGGGLLLLVLGVLGPWLIVGRPRWGLWGAYLVSVLPYLVLDVPNVHGIGLHYYATSAVVGALSVAGRTRSYRPVTLPVVAACLLLLGPLGVTWFDDGYPPGLFVFRDAWEKRERNRALHELAASITEGPVSVAQPLVAFVDPRVEAYPWPSPYTGLVLQHITPVPIVEADPEVEPRLVLAPRRGFDYFVPPVTAEDEQRFGLRQVGEVEGVVVFEDTDGASGDERGDG